ncbi:zf-C3HC-domain-containing protein [Tuber magnatum]|uniref:Zf-C3HC-domain-containing protein n=1 Tax=Tuber magnatum TaxID=42249 RepID=A0A317SQ04_9PEZI|nr:zf-C3HC-domain-containing protein [Tuber magnatum]
MLYSTKRKLHNLINGPPAPSTSVSAPNTPAKQSIDPPPTTTTTIAFDDNHVVLIAPPADDAAKKRRLGGLGNRSRPSVRAVSPAGSIRSTVSTTSSQQLPTYSPWDRNAFLERLRTYRFVDKWSAKPTDVNEVKWARRGWSCVDKNRVRCGVCKREVVVKVELDEEQDSDITKAVVEKYKEMIVTEHEGQCLWKKRGCDDTIYRLQLANPSVSRPSFISRYSSLLRIRPEIPPSLSYSTADLPEHILEAIHENTLLVEEQHSGALTLALFGWQNEDPGIPSLVTCSACFRRLGLWLFRKKAVSIFDSVDEEEEASVCRLDVIGEHRDYCPWINATNQGTEPGWQIMLRILQQPNKGPALGSYNTQSSPPRDPERPVTPAERDAEDESKLKRLRKLGAMYLGTTRKTKGKGKENKERPKTPRTPKTPTKEAPPPKTPKTPKTPSRDAPKTPKTPKTPSREA